MRLFLVLLIVLCGFSLQAGSLQLYEDYFSIDSKGKNIVYRPYFNFWTDMDEEKLRDAAKKAFQKGVTAAFLGDPEDSDSGEKKLPDKIKEKLEKALIKEFGNLAMIKEMIDREIQFDMYFLPEKDDPNSFNRELTSNFLINFDKNEDLLELMDQETMPWKFKYIQRPMNYIMNHSKATETYTYLGGVISIAFKILDVRLSLLSLLRLPNPFEKGIKGFIRYRRYFAMNPIEVQSFKKGDVKEVSLSYTPGGRTVYVTADIIKTFTLGELKPSYHSMELHFGQLLDSFDNDIITAYPSVIDDKGNLTRNFNIGQDGAPVMKNISLPVASTYPELKGICWNTNQKFKVSMMDLSYDYKKQKFDSGRSRFVNGDVLLGGVNGVWLQHTLLKNLKNKFMADLNLVRIQEDYLEITE